MWEDIEKHEKETREEERREAEEDELRWQQHAGSQLQEEEDRVLREEMEARGRKKKITREVTMRIANGTVVGQGEQTAVVNAGDRVMVQFAFRPEEAAQEEETTRDEQVEMVEQDAADEEVLQLGALEYPESAA